MTLTVAGGPFGHAPAGSFHPGVDRERVLFFDPYPRRIRGALGGEWIVDSTGGLLVHEHGQLPRLYFPQADLRMDLLEVGETGSDPSLLGDVESWTLCIGNGTIEGAGRSHPNPPASAPEGFADLIALDHGALDEWFEEDEVSLAHVRDPYHRVDALRSSRRVRISLGGAVLAETSRSRVIYETGLPARWYLPIDDVAVDLVPSGLETVCAYKGRAHYWSVHAGGELHENLAWGYREPLHDAALVAGHVAFFNERVDLEIDGVLQPEIWTPWAKPGWWKPDHDLAHIA